MSKLNQLIGFLEEQLTVSEPIPDYTRHNQEIITYIEYLKSMKQLQLNENQQILLDWLKESCKLYGLREVIEIIGFLPTTGGKMKYKQIAYAYADQLDEPKKVVVPPMIAKFIRESDDPIYEICTWADYYDSDGRTCEDSELSAVINWYGKNSNEFYQAVINGYEVKEEPTIHELKILPEYFEAVVSGNKRFEIRKNDRNSKKGDILRLNEYQDGQYTGDVHVAEITYITDYAQQDGYVVLGIK
ncbi:DUF3850 domain-containing protein [Enterococcus faecalis]|nr:DUF3850 domain-containing protein [Enterococcus faecalis]